MTIAYPPDRPMGYDELPDFVEERLPSGPIVLLGESFSGPVAMDLATALPDRVVGLVLAATFADPPMPRVLYHVARMIDHTWIPKRVINAFVLEFTGRSEIGTQLFQILTALPREVVRVRTTETLRVDKTAELASITCPTLCLFGSRDRLVRRGRTEVILDGVQNCQKAEFDAPHMLLQTHPDHAAKAVDRFCSTLV